MMLGIMAGQRAQTNPDTLTPPVIGEYWADQGGYYAGVSVLGHYVIVAPRSSEVVRLYKTTNTDTAGTGSADASALDLRAATETAGLPLHPAMSYCASYSGGGFTDWCLPGSREASVIDANLNPSTTAAVLFQVGGAQQYRNALTHPNVSDRWYWLGRTTTAASAMQHRPSAPAGLSTWPDKATNSVVRPVRIVPV